MSVALVLGCALLGGVGGAAVPAVVRRLPQPDTESLHLPEGEEPPPSYATVAAAPGLLLRTALLGALAAGLLAWSVGPEPALVGLVAVVPVAVALGVVDLRTRLLPKVLVLPATGLLVAVASVAALLGGPAEVDALVRSLVGLVAARTAYWLLWFFRSAGLGFGDVRLAAMVGAGLGPLGWVELLVGLYAGFVIFGVLGTLWALVRRDRSLMRAAHPLGPFLLVGALLGVLLGDAAARGLGQG